MVKDFGDRFKRFADELRAFNPGPKMLREAPYVWGTDRELLSRAVRWLAEEVSRHASVDTFAKKLFLRGDADNLRKLKAVLSTYLAIEQARNNVDKRYDSFLASVLKLGSDKNVLLPEHLRILTWNYDTQFEKAFCGFCRDEDLVRKGSILSQSLFTISMVVVAWAIQRN